MTTKALPIIILTLFFSISFGQKIKNISFRELDAATGSNSDLREIVTDKIVFLNGNDLDIKKSRLALDSLVWFLSRHPKVIISLTLLKAQPITTGNSQLGQKQSKQIIGYVTKKGINSTRIISTVSYEGQNSSDKSVVKTRIRLLSQNFLDPDTK